MVQETAPAVVERGVAASASSPLEPPAPAKPLARSQVSQLALAALWLAIGTSLSVALVGLDAWLMGQGALDTHDLPELATYVLPLPTLLTLVLAFLAKGRIAKSGGALGGRGVVRGSRWLSGLTVAVLLLFAGLLLTGAGESYMCGVASHQERTFRRLLSSSTPYLGGARWERRRSTPNRTILLMSPMGSTRRSLTL